MGGDLLRVFFEVAGLDPRYYLSGFGLPPDPAEGEIILHVEYLELELKRWREYLHALNNFKREQFAILAAEPERSYKSKHRSKKK